MKKNLNKIISLLLLLVLMFSTLPAMNVNAASTQGNITPTITYRLGSGDTLFIEGQGEIPDYLEGDILSRPWRSVSFTKINIAPTITRVGTYAFSGNGQLKQIDISSTTFLAGNSCFANSHRDCIVRIHGDAPIYEELGNISYSTWDSIASGAPNGWSTLFVLDNENAAANFRALRYPFFMYVYSADAKDSPWNKRDRYFDDDVFSNVCRIVYPNNISSISFSKQPLSEGFMKNMGEFTKLFNYTYVCSYMNYYFEKNKPVYTPSSLMTRYEISLEPKDQVNVKYKLIQISHDQNMYIYDDIDTNLKTVTFETNNASGFYILVY